LLIPVVITMQPPSSVHTSTLASEISALMFNATAAAPWRLRSLLAATLQLPLSNVEIAAVMDHANGVVAVIAPGNAVNAAQEPAGVVRRLQVAATCSGSACVQPDFRSLNIKSAASASNTVEVTVAAYLPPACCAAANGTDPTAKAASLTSMMNSDTGSAQLAYVGSMVTSDTAKGVAVPNSYLSTSVDVSGVNAAGPSSAGTSSSQSNSKLSTGALIGIVVGGVAFAAIVAVGAAFAWNARKSNRNAAPPNTTAITVVPNPYAVQAVVPVVVLGPAVPVTSPQHGTPMASPHGMPMAFVDGQEHAPPAAYAYASPDASADHAQP